MLMLVLSLSGTACWVICFWWMHRISFRQNALMKELHEITQRIEHLSREEHDLIREVHPKVSEIKQQVENVADAISPETSSTRR